LVRIQLNIAKFHTNSWYRLQKRPVVGRLFDYMHDMDERGVIYYLSTNCLKSDWKNASLTGSIKVTASSIEKGKVHNVVDREPVECWTKCAL